VYTGFGSMVEESGPSTALAMVHSACAAVTYLSSSVGQEMSGTIRNTHILSSVMLVTYTLYHTYTATYSLPPDLCADSLRCDEAHPVHEQLGGGADREIFLSAASCVSLATRVAELLRDPNKSSHASRLLQVLGATPYPSVLVALWQNLEACRVLVALITTASSSEENVNNVENALLALGTLAGAPALFPWECAFLSQKLALNDVEETEIGAPFKVLSAREKALLMAAQVRAQLRIDPHRSGGIENGVSVQDTGDAEADLDLKRRQQEKERKLRKDLCGLVASVVVPSLSCAREGIRVVGKE
jgi:hypothetical protein